MWFMILIQTLTNITHPDGSLRVDHYWTLPGYKSLLEIVQCQAAFEVVFAALKFTNNNPVAVFTQVLSRIFVLMMIFPLVPKGHYSIFQCALSWSIIESIRFPFYILKQFPSLDKSFLSNILGHLRYNAFIIVYITGVAGELLAIKEAFFNVRENDVKPYTVNMPNKYNFSFEFEYLLMILPLVYTFVFPQLYMMMCRHRTRFY
jgi:very-long-chain (3R)-3-hydroxyacyl-CoA dehydratase